MRSTSTPVRSRASVPPSSARGSSWDSRRVDLARWRSLGLELAFDPERLPARFTAQGQAQLRADLLHLDAERLVELYPREPDDRLPLDEMVLLAAVELVQPLRAPKQAWLVAE